MNPENPDKTWLTTFTSATTKLYYKEIPVSISEFIRNEGFIGKLTKKDGVPGKAIFPIWRRELSFLMSEPTKYIPVFTGAIGCLSAGVKISLLDGRELTIPEIIEERKEGKQHWVYSYDSERKRMVPGRVIDALLSGSQVSNIVEVELDNKEKIHCTHNHPFLLTSGKYKEAQDLQPGDSLMPLYRYVSELGYELSGIYKQQWEPTFHIVSEEINGPTPEGFCIHHKNVDKTNNSPENLQLLTVKEHRHLHANVLNPFKNIPGFAAKAARKSNKKRWEGPNNKEQRKQASQRLKKRNRERGQAKKATETRWSTGDVEAKRKKESDRLRKRNKETGQASRASRIRWSKPESSKNYSEKMRDFYQNQEHRSDCNCPKCHPEKCSHKGKKNGMYGKHAWNKLPMELRKCKLPECNIIFECTIKSKKKFCSYQCSGKSRRGKRAWNSGLTKQTNDKIAAGGKKSSKTKFEKKKAIMIECLLNHKVISVRRLNTPEEVYDLSIEKYHNFALTAGVFVHNTGKSRAAIIGIAYCMYLHLCLRDPWSYYGGKTGGGKMAIVFFNLNKTLGETKGFRILQNHLLSSEWFREKGRISGNIIETQTIHFPLFEYVLASPNAQAEVGQDVIAALMDEVDSLKAGLKQREKVVASVESALQRFENRFVIHGQTLGKFFIVASKQENLSFLNAFIAKKKGNKEVHIVDVPIWEAKEEEFHNCEKFPVQVGDIYSPSKILNSEEEVRESIANGFTVIHVPEQFRRAFEEDIVVALRNFAGISSSYLRKNKLFKSEKYLLDCYNSNKQDPVKIITIYLGVKEKEKELIHFLDINKIRVPRYIPRYIHGDIAFAHDSYGLAMSGISGWKEITRTLEDGNVVVDKVSVVETDFVMRIKAPENDEVDLSKVRKFIIDLKKIYGFNIQLATFDLKLLSTDNTQILEKAGIKCEYLSIDKNPQFYRSFRDDLVKEGRWICHKHPYLHFELTNLEEDSSTNKIDHPKEVPVIEFLDDGNTRDIVVEGSKDCSDAVVVSVEQAIKECKTPPNVEIMKKAFEVGTKKDKLDGLWWVDPGSLKGKSEERDKKVDEVLKQDLASKYKNIFKRSQM